MKISVCFGTLNEEKAVTQVIEDIQNVLADHDVNFYITDSGDDKTADIATSLGAKVFKQERLGYGKALVNSLNHAKGDIILTTDCDNTYPAKHIPEMLKKIEEGYDVVSASRFLGKEKLENMSEMNQFGNRLFAWMVSVLYSCKCTDASTGMRLYKKEVIDGIEWTENTGLSLELFFKPVAVGFKVIEVPINYHARVGDVKLNPWKGGLDMLVSIVKWKLRKVEKKEKV